MDLGGMWVFRVFLTLQLLTFVLGVESVVGGSVRGCALPEREDCISLNSLELDGYISFYDTEYAARDFGLLRTLSPAAILYPGSVEDIALVVRTISRSVGNLTVAAKGPGHSVNGQAQVLNGVVIEMSTLRGITVNPSEHYVDARGGELWVNVLQSTLAVGLSPLSFTDYLHLSVGGTLSNAGISGQSFRYGPQISNVLLLEVVTGKGEIVTCSEQHNEQLFFAVLGGLGQFGIITKARIRLQRAPGRVRWIRAVYSDFAAFIRDQLMLISLNNNDSVFDYVEGFVVPHTGKSRPGWKSKHVISQSAVNSSFVPSFASAPVLYYIELTKTYDMSDVLSIDERVADMLAPLGNIPSFLYSTDVSYYDFLDRVHKSELAMRPQGEENVAHPWMNLFVPRSKISDFDMHVFRNLCRGTITGPLLVYPLNRNKWDRRTSAVVPDEDVFYLVAFLQNAVPTAGPTLETLLYRNEAILNYCQKLGCKEYLPRYLIQSDWETHFARQWPKFVQNKNMFDPQALLSPGQNIFVRGRIPPASPYAIL